MSLEKPVEQEAKQKLLTFKEICPIWFKILTGKRGYTPQNDIVNIANPKCCIVGEAHKFGGGKGYKYGGCDKCSNFSYSWINEKDFYHHFQKEFFSQDVKILTESEIENDPLVKEFVDHWNEAHVK